MIEYVIKMNGDQIEGHPIFIENFKHAMNITERISVALIEEKGYAPFFKNEMPTVSVRQKVDDHGYFKDTDGFVKHDYRVVDKTAEELLSALDVIKTEKKDQVRRIFSRVSVMSVTDTNGAVWNGGFDSAVKLDAAKRLADTAGLENVVFFDASNGAHTLSMVEATAVVLTVANAYQAALAQKQSLLLQITNATTVEAVDSANWVGITVEADLT